MLADHVQKWFAPRTHLDTLNSTSSRPPLPPQPSTVRTPSLPSASKRQKIRRRDDEIVDDEQDATSRTERHGSQSSFAQSVSPGIAEYMNVEAAAKQMGRSNRRSRQTNANPRRDMTRELETIESFDELGPAPKPTLQRTARLVSTKGGALGAPLRDAADHGILGKADRASQRPEGLNKGKKRSSHEITDDPDELVEETNGGGVSKADVRTPAGDSSERSPPSLSRRGDLKATKWESKKGANTISDGFGVQSAVCQPNLRYGMGEGQAPCFLKPTIHGDLRAHTDDGSKAPPYEWLRITAKAKNLTYHPDSNLVKVNQAKDLSSPTTIGGLMMLKFCSSDEATQAVHWALDNLNQIKITLEEDRYGCRASLVAVTSADTI